MMNICVILNLNMTIYVNISFKPEQPNIKLQKNEGNHFFIVKLKSTHSLNDIYSSIDSLFF